MSTSYDAIYLSSHLDDVVLSCGGQIAARTRRGESVLVVTVVAGDAEGELTPLARQMNAAWKLDGSFAARRGEDSRACALLGADCRHEAGLDAMYRRHPKTHEPFYATLQDVLGPVHPDDSADSIWTDFLKRLPAAKDVIAPLGAGGHVDHRLVRRAAETVYGRALAYYEDYPYANKLLALRKVVWPPWRWRACILPLAPEDVRARCDATAAYASQIDMIFAGAWQLEPKITRYVRRVGGERLWSKRV
jgi:LmbE family N-acetylglucosaminyl deacetylase